MKWNASLRQSVAAALILMSATPVTVLSAVPSPGDNQGTVTAITQPSDRRQLSFAGRGIIREEAVKEGDTVKKGQTLLVQDDRIDRAQLESLKLQANSVLEVEYAEKDLAVKRSTLKRIEGMFATNAAPESELEEARLAVERAETQVKLARQEKEQKKYEASAKGFQVEWMTLNSPIDGVVEKILNKVGETTNPEPDRPSVVVVQNDPIWVVMYLPNKVVDQLRPDDTFHVRYDDKQEWQPAKVQFISPVADAKSFKRLVRLEMPNPETIAGGHEVTVKLPDRVTAAGATPGVASTNR